jgi:hypothetical protein
MTDWKELDDVEKPCSNTNGWCGWCGNCREHSEELIERESWGDDE